MTVSCGITVLISIKLIPGKLTAAKSFKRSHSGPFLCIYIFGIPTEEISEQKWI